MRWRMALKALLALESAWPNRVAQRDVDEARFRAELFPFELFVAFVVVNSWLRPWAALCGPRLLKVQLLRDAQARHGVRGGRNAATAGS